MPTEQLTDRGLDAWIAEHIMGLAVYHHAWPCGYQPDGCGLEACQSTELSEYYPERHPVYDHGTRPLDPDEAFVWLEVVPFYSTDIADAWLVIEQLDQWEVTIVRRHHCPDDPDSPFEYEVEIALRDPAMCRACLPQVIEVTAPTLPLAICRAALSAVLQGV